MSIKGGGSVRTVTGSPPSRWLLGRRKGESRESWSEVVIRDVRMNEF